MSDPEHPEADRAHMVGGTVRKGLQRMRPPGIVDEELTRITDNLAADGYAGRAQALQELRELVNHCELAERLSLSVCVRAAVAELDAHAAADKPDVRLHDRDSYIAGYQDARTDADEAMRREFDK